MLLGFLELRLVIPFQYDVTMTIRAAVFTSGALEMVPANAIGNKNGLCKQSGILQIGLETVVLLAPIGLRR